MTRFSDIRQAILSQGGSSGIDLSQMNNLMQSSALNFKNSQEYSNKLSEQINELNKKENNNNNNNNNTDNLYAYNYNENIPLTNKIQSLNQNTSLQYNNSNNPINTNNSAPLNNNLAAYLAKYEGGGNYDTLFGHSQKDGGRFAGIRPSTMTLDQLREFTSPNGEYAQWVKSQIGKVATPVGAGQIVGSTLNNAVRDLGLSGNTVFTSDIQNKVINYLAQKRIDRANSVMEAVNGLRNEWEGFKNVPTAQLVSLVRPLSNGRF